MCYAFTPNSVFKLVLPFGSEPTWQTSMLYSDIVPLIYVNETICMVICPSSGFKLIILWSRMNHFGLENLLPMFSSEMRISFSRQATLCPKFPEWNAYIFNILCRKLCTPRFGAEMHKSGSKLYTPRFQAEMQKVSYFRQETAPQGWGL